MFFLALTQFHPSNNDADGSPTYVNMKMVIEMSRNRCSVVRTDEDRSKAYKDRPTEEYTTLSFAAATSEDIIGTNVKETPELIMRMIPQMLG